MVITFDLVRIGNAYVSTSTTQAPADRRERTKTGACQRLRRFRPHDGPTRTCAVRRQVTGKRPSRPCRRRHRRCTGSARTNLSSTSSFARAGVSYLHFIRRRPQQNQPVCSSYIDSISWVVPESRAMPKLGLLPVPHRGLVLCHDAGFTNFDKRWATSEDLFSPTSIRDSLPGTVSGRYPRTQSESQLQARHFSGEGVIRPNEWKAFVNAGRQGRSYFPDARSWLVFSLPTGSISGELRFSYTSRCTSSLICVFPASLRES